MKVYKLRDRIQNPCPAECDLREYTWEVLFSEPSTPRDIRGFFEDKNLDKEKADKNESAG